jgi:hypothetical protein
LVIDDNVDHSRLRELDQPVNGKYTVVAANNKSAMRGLDYRSESVKMTLVVAKSFENKREAMQGYHRVGRFDDQCWRVEFKDVPLIDPKAQTKYNLDAYKFVAAMQKKPIQMKAVPVKPIIVPQ